MARWPGNSERSKSCLGCTGSGVLASGPREGALWCYVHGASKNPIDCCSSFIPCSNQEEKSLALEAGPVGRSVLGGDFGGEAA